MTTTKRRYETSYCSQSLLTECVHNPCPLNSFCLETLGLRQTFSHRPMSFDLLSMSHNSAQIEISRVNAVLSTYFLKYLGVYWWGLLFTVIQQHGVD